MQASDSFSRLCATLKSAGKMLLQSKRCRIERSERHAPLVIMANGPSLRSVIDAYLTELQNATTMAVNFAANAPEFRLLQPDFYILADPHFFSGAEDVNLANLRVNLAAASWPMTLLVPVGKEKSLPVEIAGNRHISISTFNMVGVEGFSVFERLAYSRKLGMPRPRNVLVPSIACAIWLGFKHIYIIGADHSWIKNLDVDADNHVISVQPHFYRESGKEQKRIDAVYRGVHLHQVVESFAVALRSYHDLQAWAQAEQVSIFNATPGSLIDAFPRAVWPDPQ